MKTMAIWSGLSDDAMAPESQNIDKYQINGKVVNPDPENDATVFVLNITVSHPKRQNHNIHSTYNISFQMFALVFRSRFHFCHIHVCHLFRPFLCIHTRYEHISHTQSTIPYTCVGSLLPSCEQHLWSRYIFAVSYICHTKRNKINKKMWIVDFPAISLERYKMWLTAHNVIYLFHT